MKKYPFNARCVRNNQLFAFISLSLLVFSCNRPDQAGPDDGWCTSGVNVLTVDDSNVPAATKTQIYAAPAAYTAVGSANYNPSLPFVVIPFQFPSSWPFNTTVNTARIRTDFFESGVGSIRDYFSENSWGQYNIREGSIANVAALYQDTVAYAAGQLGRDWSRNPNLARDICQTSNVNWASIDANSDRVITRNEAQICFLGAFGPAGGCRPSTVTISTSTGAYTIHGNFIYIGCKANNDPTKGTDDIRFNYSTIWHELCHGMFGLPDRYTDYCGSGRTGAFDIMSDNCSWRHMSIYDKMKIGWIRPRILEKPSRRSDRARHCYTFPNSQTSPAALILWDNNQPNEYWIVENRFKPGSPRSFDRDLPESGLAIWWVNEETDALSLIDARDPSVRPQNILYTAGADQTRVLFANRSGMRDTAYNMQLLRSGYNSTEFAIRAPSPAGATMYAEF